MSYWLTNKVTHLLVIVCLLISSIIFIDSSQTLAYTALQNRNVALSNTSPSAPTTYQVNFTYTNTSTLVGSVAIQFCANSPIFFVSCSVPAGFSLSSMTLSNQTGETGFTASAISANEVLLVRNPADPHNIASSYELDNIVNPNSIGEYYIKLSTYSSITGSQSTVPQTAIDDAAGYGTPANYPATVIENGGIAYDINPGFTVDAIVPPYINFCAGITINQFNCGSASGNQINFGNFASNVTRYASSQFLVGTNSQTGYTITLNGTTLTSGNNLIPSNSVPSGALVGSSRFGINLTNNSIPSVGGNVSGSGSGVAAANYNIKNNYLYNDGDVIAYAVTESQLNKFTVSYIVDVSSGQPLGVYATTLSYIAVSNF